MECRGLAPRGKLIDSPKSLQQKSVEDSEPGVLVVDNLCFRIFRFLYFSAWSHVLLLNLVQELVTKICPR